MTPEDKNKAIVDVVTAKLLPEHEQWLTKFTAECDLSFDRLMEGARDWVLGGHYTHIGVDIDYEAMSEEFWKHYEGYTAEQVPENKRDSFFSCAC